MLTQAVGRAGSGSAPLGDSLKLPHLLGCGKALLLALASWESPHVVPLPAAAQARQVGEGLGPSLTSEPWRPVLIKVVFVKVQARLLPLFFWETLAARYLFPKHEPLLSAVWPPDSGTHSPSFAGGLCLLVLVFTTPWCLAQGLAQGAVLPGRGSLSQRCAPAAWFQILLGLMAPLLPAPPGHTQACPLPASWVAWACVTVCTG